MLYNSNWYGGHYQDMQTALGSWYGPVEMLRTTTQGQSVYPDIALYISNYRVYVKVPCIWVTIPCIEGSNYHG
jgi:hypothetical protein